MRTSQPLVSTSATSWLRRALLVSLLLHLMGAVVGHFAVPGHSSTPEVSLIDVELAPPAPKAEALPEKALAAAQPQLTAPVPTSSDDKPSPPDDEPGEGKAVDAGLSIDARVKSDARPKADARMPIDAGVDAAMDAALDASSDAATTADASIDAVPMVAKILDAGAPVDGTAVAVRDHAVAATVTQGQTIGQSRNPFITPPAPAFTDGTTPSLVAPGGPPTTAIGEPGAVASAGTTANLLAYMPPSHIVTVLLRFDRLRGTVWADAAIALFHAFPDYKTIVGDRDVKISDIFDTLVISSYSPRDPLATTLIARTSMTRAALRAFLDQPQTPVKWSASWGGLLGKRGAGERVIPGDARVYLSPYLGWFVLAPPTDLPGLLTNKRGDLDSSVASVALPPWLTAVHDIEKESGEPDGPAMVVSMARPAQRIVVPDIGLDIPQHDLPSPIRANLALEVVSTGPAQGFVVRGNLRFATAVDASEFVVTAESVRAHVLDSFMLKKLLSKSKTLNAVQGLSLIANGEFVTYATSMSVGDGQGLLAVLAKVLEKQGAPK